MPLVFGEEYLRTPGVSEACAESTVVDFPEEVGSFVLLAAKRVGPLLEDLAKAPWERLSNVGIVVSDPAGLRTDLRDSRLQELLAQPKFQLGLVPRAEEFTIEAYVRLLGTGEVRASSKTYLKAFGEDDPAIRGIFEQLQNLHRSALALQAAQHHPLDYVLMKDIPIGFSQTLQNLSRIYRSPDLRNLHRKFQNRAALLLGAGPSLGNQWEVAKRLSEHALVIGADTLLKPAAERGLRLDVISSIERDPGIIPLINVQRGVDQTLLVASSVLDPRALAGFGGPQSLSLPPVDFIHALPIKRMVIPSGHTCVALGLQVAAILGCHSLYLLGVDLAFSPEGNSHISNVPYAGEDEFTSLMDAFRLSAYDVVSNTGGKIRTHFYWSMFRQELEQMIQRSSMKCFNLSPTGAAIAGAPFISEQDSIRAISAQPTFRFEDLRREWAYDRHAEAKAELPEWRKKIEIWKDQLGQMEKSLATRETWHDFVKQTVPEFQFALSPLIRRTRPTTSHEETRVTACEILQLMTDGVLAAESQIPELEKDVQLF